MPEANRDYIGARTREPEDKVDYGVKGMKWGVHHTPLTKTQAKAHTKAVGDMDKSGVKLLNASPKYAGKSLKANSKLGKEYEKDAAALFDHYYANRIQRASANKNYKRYAAVSLVVGAARLGAFALVAHADESPDIINLKLELDDLGQIVGFHEVDEDLMGDNELEHHGIKGMKWGRRRSPAQLAAAKQETEGSSSSSSSTKKPEGPESSSDRYARLQAQAKGGGASKMDDADLKFLNARTEALAKVSKLTEQKPGWLSETGKKVLRSAAEKQLQSVADSIANKYISEPIVKNLKDNSKAIAAESKTPVDYIGKRRAKKS